MRVLHRHHEQLAAGLQADERSEHAALDWLMVRATEPPSRGANRQSLSKRAPSGDFFPGSTRAWLLRAIGRRPRRIPTADVEAAQHCHQGRRYPVADLAKGSRADQGDRSDRIADGDGTVGLAPGLPVADGAWSAGVGARKRTGRELQSRLVPRDPLAIGARTRRSRIPLTAGAQVRPVGPSNPYPSAANPSSEPSRRPGPGRVTVEGAPGPSGSLGPGRGTRGPIRRDLPPTRNRISRSTWRVPRR